MVSIISLEQRRCVGNKQSVSMVFNEKYKQQIISCKTVEQQIEYDVKQYNHELTAVLMNNRLNIINNIMLTNMKT